MKTYKKMLEEATKNKATKSIQPVYHDWATDGKHILGVFVSKAEVDSRFAGKGYYQYIFDTDEGLRKVALGRAADNDMAETFSPGMLYSIIFKGKEEIGGNKSVNVFEVLEVSFGIDSSPEPEAETDDSAKPPK